MEQSITQTLGRQYIMSGGVYEEVSCSRKTNTGG